MFWKSCFSSGLVAALTVMAGAICRAQQAAPDRISTILERLDQLEKQNREVLSEIQALRQELEAAKSEANQAPESVEEKVDVAEQRIKEQAQTKVEASQRFPISLTGMFLFDSFLTRAQASPDFVSLYDAYSLGPQAAGASLQESTIGFDFRGPQVLGDGHVNGFLMMDFYGGQSAYSFRIRRGEVSFDWKRRSIIFGQDKSIIAPLEPTSFARVAVPPLSGAGNLWLWRPQVTYEERVPFSKATGATFEASVFETDESNTVLATGGNSYYVEPDRPALQARIQLQHSWSDTSRISVGVAGDGSTSHVLGESIPSRVMSADLLVAPSRWVQISGTILRGKNFANLGGVPGGVTVGNWGAVIPIRGTAGWAQLSLPVTKRLTFDLYGGRQVNDPRDLSSFEVLRTYTIAGNVLYRIAPNVVLGFEGARNRVDYLNALMFWANRYDATVAYLF